MATTITMPQLSDTMHDGTIITWLKSEGDNVQIGDAIAEISTDIANLEIESTEEGTLLKILGEVGAKVQVGMAIGVIGQKGESVDEAIKASSGASRTGGGSPAGGASRTGDGSPVGGVSHTGSEINIGDINLSQPKDYSAKIDSSLSKLFKEKASSLNKVSTYESQTLFTPPVQTSSQEQSASSVQTVSPVKFDAWLTSPVRLAPSAELDSAESDDVADISADSDSESDESVSITYKPQMFTGANQDFGSDEDDEIEAPDIFVNQTLINQALSKPVEEENSFESSELVSGEQETKVNGDYTDDDDGGWERPVSAEEHQSYFSEIMNRPYTATKSSDDLAAEEESAEESNITYTQEPLLSLSTENEANDYVELDESKLRDGVLSWQNAPWSNAKVVTGNRTEESVLEKSLRDVLKSVKDTTINQQVVSGGDDSLNESNLNGDTFAGYAEKTRGGESAEVTGNGDYFAGYSYEELIGSGELVEPEAERLNYMEQPLEGFYSDADTSEYVTASNYFFMTIKVMVDGLLDVVTTLRQSGKYPNLSINHLIIKATGLALAKNFGINYSCKDGQVSFTDKIDLGVITLVDGRITTPVIQDAGSFSLAEISQQALKLSKQAKTEDAPAPGFGSATFTISNVGNSSIENIGMTIDAQEGALLMLSAICDEPVALSREELEVKSVLRMTLSADNKVVSTVTAVKFLNDLKMMLEKPALILG